MIKSRGRLILLWLCVAPAGLLAQSDAGSSPMQALLAEFRAAHSPSAAELLGRWVLVLNVNTQAFLTGQSGPDHVEADSAGVRDGSKGSELYWVLDISKGADGQLIAKSTTTWAGNETSLLRVSANDGVRFDKDYGGDSPYPYRCRLSGDRLICVFDEPKPGHGVVFRRTE